LSTWLHQVSGWIERVGGAVIIFLGLMLVGAIKLPWLSRSHQWRVTAPAGAGTARRLFFAFLGGLIFGVGWTPCLGPVLAAILVLAGQGGSVAAGAQLLFIYTLGLMVPLLVISLGIDTAQKFLSRGAKWFNIVNKLAGTILVIVGVILLLGVWPKLLGALFSLIA
jgi:cytochrome c-type biogenesis protein